MPVSPRECALALAIPLTRKQFLADLSRPDEKDFVHHFRAMRGLQKAEAEFCWQVYEDDEATFAEAVCDGAERLGVTVLREIRLSQLTDLLKRFPVVTLVTHWRFVPVEPEDIQDAVELLKILQSPKSDVQRSIKQAFELLDSELLETDAHGLLSSKELSARIAKVISTVADKAEALYWDEEASEQFNLEQMSDGLKERLTRLEFEQGFPGYIAPARVIEFQDRMHTVPELISAIPRDFSGLLDLTVCNSVIPAASIKSRRPNCLIAANRRPAELRSRMYLYGLEISLLSKKPVPFVDVIKQVHAGKSTYKGKSGKLWTLLGKFFKSTRNQ
jgi:hypothetical protein